MVCYVKFGETMSIHDKTQNIWEELVRIREVLALSALINAGQDKRSIILELEKHCFPDKLEAKWAQDGARMDPETGDLLIGLEKVTTKWVGKK